MDFDLLAKKNKEIKLENLHLYRATRKKNVKALRINNIQNAVDSLLRAEENIDQVENNAFYWKWVIICLQNSLYTFALTVAAGSDWANVAIIPKKIFKKYDNDYHKVRENIDFSEIKCVDFLSAVKKCNGLQYFTYSNPLELTNSQKNSIVWLHDHFRNNFEHFKPNNWRIELEGFPNICVDTLEVIKFLAIDGKHITYGTKSKKIKTKKSINRSIKKLKSSKFYCDPDKINIHPELSKYFP